MSKQWGPNFWASGPRIIGDGKAESVGHGPGPKLASHATARTRLSLVAQLRTLVRVAPPAAIARWRAVGFDVLLYDPSSFAGARVAFYYFPHSRVSAQFYMIYLFIITTSISYHMSFYFIEI